MCPVYHIERRAHLIDPVFELLLYAFKELIHILIVSQISCIRSEMLAQRSALFPARAMLAAVQASSAVEYHFHEFSCIYICSIMPAVFPAGDRRLYTAYDRIICRFIMLYAFLLESLYRRSIIEDLRMSVTCPDTLNDLHL